MKLRTEKGTNQTILPPKLAVANLKLCPLCDSLNARKNNSCFVCGWHGQFIHDSHRVHLSLVLLLEQCPELSEGVKLEKPKRNWLGRFFSFFAWRKPAHHHVDLWA